MVVQVVKGRGELAHQSQDVSFLVITSLFIDSPSQGSGICKLHDDANVAATITFGVVVVPFHNLIAFDDVIVLNTG